MSNRLGQQLGNYLLISFLGAGGLANVYLGKHIALKTLAAIKVLNVPPSHDHLQEIRNQALIVAPFAHPNILRIHDFNIEKDTSFLVMDYAPHGSLRDRHLRGTPLPLTTILMYVRQVAGALQYLHDQNLIHLDIKPENMLLGRNYEVLLSDFGLTVEAPNTGLQRMDKIAGTPAYMAPEQFQGRPGPASDQYALGIVVYEWLCGVRPFEGTFNEMENQHLSVSPPLLQDKMQSISPYVEAAVLTALAKNPQDRFASVQAFANALEQANQLEAARTSRIAPSPWGQVSAAPARSWDSPPPSQGSKLGDPTQASPAPWTSPAPARSWGLPPPAPPSQGSKIDDPPPITALPSKQVEVSEKQATDLSTISHLSLFATTRVLLEEDNKAFVNTTYTLRAGISQSKLEDNNDEPFDIEVDNSTTLLIFDLLLHESENIDLITEWHKKLSYVPNNKDLQFVDFTFQVTDLGPSSILVDFYHERRWLRTIKLEFESVEKSENALVRVEA